MQYEQKSTAKSKPKIAFRDDEDDEDEQDDDEDDIEEDESEDEEDADLVSTTQWRFRSAACNSSQQLVLQSGRS